MSLSLSPPVPLPPSPVPSLLADSHGTAAGSWSVPLHRHPVAPLVLVPFLRLFPSFFQTPSPPPSLSLLTSLSSAPCLPCLSPPWGSSPWLLPRASQRVAGTPALSVALTLHSKAPGVPCTPAGLSRILLGHVLTRSGVSLLAQVRRTFRRSLELRPGSCPHCLGPNVGRGSETWFSRHAPGTLPRYSSRTHRLMPCLCLLVGEVWVHQGPWWGCLGGSIPSPRNPN